VADTRVAIVTGASSGMGVAIARALARTGMRVGVGARRIDRLAEVVSAIGDDGGQAFAHPLDVSDVASVAAFFDAVEDRFGAVEVVVSNAGVCTPRLLHESDPADLAAQVATNLLGPMYAAHRAIPGMRARGAGDLTFITSEAARLPRPFQAAYSAAKAGVEVLAKTLALELEGTGVRVSAIRMGPTATEFGSGWDGPTVERILAAWKRFGLQRHMSFLAPEVIADAVVNAVTAPPGATVAWVELQPTAPIGSETEGR